MIALWIVGGVLALALIAGILIGALFVGYLLRVADDERARTRVDVTTVPAGTLEYMSRHPSRPSAELLAKVNEQRARR